MTDAPDAPAGPTGRSRLSRRRLLAAGSMAVPLAAVASCGAPNPLGGPPGPSPEVRALREAITAEQALIARYRAALAAHPGLPGPVRTILGQHEQHLSQLKGRLIVPPHVTPGPVASPPAAPAPPGSTSATLDSLATAERGAAAAQMGRLASATPSLAQLLASIAASEITHSAALTGGGA